MFYNLIVIFMAKKKQQHMESIKSLIEIDLNNVFLLNETRNFLFLHNLNFHLFALAKKNAPVSWGRDKSRRVMATREVLRDFASFFYFIFTHWIKTRSSQQFVLRGRSRRVINSTALTRAQTPRKTNKPTHTQTHVQTTTDKPGLNREERLLTRRHKLLVSWGNVSLLDWTGNIFFFRI